jgi:hypothetical protein
VSPIDISGKSCLTNFASTASTNSLSFISLQLHSFSILLVNLV